MAFSLGLAAALLAADNADAVRAMQAARDGSAAIEANDFENAVAKLGPRGLRRISAVLRISRERWWAGQLDEPLPRFSSREAG